LTTEKGHEGVSALDVRADQGQAQKAVESRRDAVEVNAASVGPPTFADDAINRNLVVQQGSNPRAGLARLRINCARSERIGRDWPNQLAGDGIPKVHA
jgi:hypothetical protein